MSKSSGKNASGPKKAAKATVKSANAIVTGNTAKISAKAKTSAKAPAKKAAAAVKVHVVGKSAKGSPKAFARGGYVSATPGNTGGYKIKRRTGVATLIQPPKTPAKKAAAVASSKPVTAKNVGAAKRAALVPFSGWAPLTSAADIDRLREARGNQFSHDYSFED